MAAGFRWTVENDASSVHCWLDRHGLALPSTAVIEVAYSKAFQCSVNLPIDLDPLALKSRSWMNGPSRLGELRTYRNEASHNRMTNRGIPFRSGLRLATCSAINAMVFGGAQDMVGQ
jgi:hypothetical protein